MLKIQIWFPMLRMPVTMKIDWKSYRTCTVRAALIMPSFKKRLIKVVLTFEGLDSEVGVASRFKAHPFVPNPEVEPNLYTD